MPKSCCVVGCHNHSMMTRKIHFFVFPRHDKYPLRRNLWLKAVNRVRRDGTPWIPSKHTPVCSDHFVTGRQNADPSSVDYVPSLFFLPTDGPPRAKPKPGMRKGERPASPTQRRLHEEEKALWLREMRLAMGATPADIQGTLPMKTSDTDVAPIDVSSGEKATTSEIPAKRRRTNNIDTSSSSATTSSSSSPSSSSISPTIATCRDLNGTFMDASITHEHDGVSFKKATCESQVTRTGDANGDGGIAVNGKNAVTKIGGVISAEDAMAIEGTSGVMRAAQNSKVNAPERAQRSTDATPNSAAPLCQTTEPILGRNTLPSAHSALRDALNTASVPNTRIPGTKPTNINDMENGWKAMDPTKTTSATCFNQDVEVGGARDLSFGPSGAQLRKTLITMRTPNGATYVKTGYMVQREGPPHGQPTRNSSVSKTATTRGVTFRKIAAKPEVTSNVPENNVTPSKLSPGIAKVPPRKPMTSAAFLKVQNARLMGANARLKQENAKLKDDVAQCKKVITQFIAIRKEMQKLGIGMRQKDPWASPANVVDRTGIGGGALRNDTTQLTEPYPGQVLGYAVVKEEPKDVAGLDPALGYSVVKRESGDVDIVGRDPASGAPVFETRAPLVVEPTDEQFAVATRPNGDQVLMDMGDGAEQANPQSELVGNSQAMCRELGYDDGSREELGTLKFVVGEAYTCEEQLAPANPEDANCWEYGKPCVTNSGVGGECKTWGEERVSANSGTGSINEFYQPYDCADSNGKRAIQIKTESVSGQIVTVAPDERAWESMPIAVMQ